MPQRHNIPGSALMAWQAIAFLYVPVLILIVFSFNASKLITIWEGFSTDWYTLALQNDDLKRATSNSLVVGFIATFIATLIALPTALAMHRHKNFRGKQATQTLIMLPLALPEIVIAVATLSFFAALHLNWGLGNVVIAHIVFCIPFAYLPIAARIQSIPHALLDAAADLYASPWKSFYFITLPLLMPGIISGALLAFITSLDDFMITQMVAPPGAMTLPVYIYSMVRRGITPEINAISSLVLLFSIFVVLASYLINRRKEF